ncbi:MAG TPA: hypothetical protein PKW68_02050 [bacterium]|nr:hypothetical protein [bacterium]
MKKILVATLVAVALLLIAAIAGPFFISTDKYRTLIERSIGGSGSRVAMSSFRLRFVPHPGYTIKNLAIISTEPPFVGQTAISVGKIEGDLSLMSLLRGEIVTAMKFYDVSVNYRVSSGVSNLGRIFGFSSGRDAPSGFERPEVDAIGESFSDADIDANVEFKSLPAAPAIDDGEPLPVPAKDSAEEVPSPDEAAEGGPQGFLLGGIISEAHAEEQAEDRAFDAGNFLSDEKLIITSLDVTSGSVSIMEEGDASPVLVTDIDFSARNIDRMPSSEEPSKKIIRAAVRASAAAFGSDVQNVSITGNLVLDEGGKVLALNDSTIYLSGVQASMDGTVNFSAASPIFDFHAATMTFTPAMLSSIYRDAINEVVSRLDWQGPVAVDIFAKGSPVVYELKVQIDSAQSSMSYGGIFSKTAGLPMKLHGSALVQSDAISIRDLEIFLGEAKLNASGFIRRDDSLSYEIKLDGNGLSDFQVKNYFPPIATVDSFKNLSATVKARGSIKNSNGDNSETRIDFTSESLGFAGIFIDAAEGSVISQGGVLEFPVIRGKFAGGSFSGNGKLERGEKHLFTFSGIASEVDPSKIQSLGGLISGNSSVVIEASSEGSDQLTIAGNMKLSGSLILDSGSWQSHNFGQLIFNQDAWRGIEAVSDFPLSAEVKSKLENIDGAISDFKATFSLSGNLLSASEVGWKNPLYEAESFSASIKYPEAGDPASDKRFGEGMIDGKGVIVIPKGISLQLVTDKGARGKLLDEQDRMLLPVKLSGTLASALVQLDHVEFAKQAEERAAKSAPSPATDPAKATTAPQEKKSPKAVVSGKKSPLQAAPKSAFPNKEPLPDGQSSEKKETGDLLRVIIGR